MKVSGALLGAFIGTLFAPGIGTAFGAAAGARTGKIINDSDVREASSRETECRRRYNNAQAEYSSANSAVCNAQTQINSLTSQCQKLESKCAQYNEKVKKLFFCKASVFWNEFHDISNHTADRTSQLQKIISKAKEEVDVSWLDSSPTRKMKNTFLDAWMTIETKCHKGAEFLFQIEQ